MWYLFYSNCRAGTTATGGLPSEVKTKNPRRQAVNNDMKKGLPPGQVRTRLGCRAGRLRQIAVSDAAWMLDVRCWKLRCDVEGQPRCKLDVRCRMLEVG